MAVCSVALVTGTMGLTGCSSHEYHRSAGRTADDEKITAKVKTDLHGNSVMKGSDVNVATYNGHVQLNGWVDTPEQKDEAENVARDVKGVVAVQNNLALKEAAGAPVP